MMKKVVSVLLFSLLGCCLNSCKDGGPVVVTGKPVTSDLKGKWTGERTYENQHFDVRLQVPEGWELSKEANQGAELEASEMIADGDKEVKERLQEAVELSHQVCSISEHPVDTVGVTNPNVLVLIENLTGVPGIKHGGDYLELVEKTINVNYELATFGPSAKKVNFGGSLYWTRSSVMEIEGVTVSQTYYAKLAGRHVLVIAFTTMSEQDVRKVEPLRAAFGAL